MASKKVVGEMDEDVATFVLARNPNMSLDDTPYTAIGQINAAGQICGGTVFTNYTKRDVHASIAGEGNWLTRRFLGECFRYIFLKLGCERCTVLVADSNTRSQKFVTQLGYVYEGTMRRFLPEGEDCHVFGMLREECRWLKAGLYDTQRQRTGPSVSRLAHGPTTAPGQRRGPSIARLAQRS